MTQIPCQASIAEFRGGKLVLTRIYINKMALSNAHKDIINRLPIVSENESETIYEVETYDGLTIPVHVLKP
jgi:hypothetical protein